MNKTPHMDLGDHYSGFVENLVGSGRYGSASDAIQAGLRLLEEQELRMAALRAALIEGEQSGPSETFDVEAFVAQKRDQRPA